MNREENLIRSSREENCNLVFAFSFFRPFSEVVRSGGWGEMTVFWYRKWGEWHSERELKYWMWMRLRLNWEDDGWTSNKKWEGRILNLTWNFKLCVNKWKLRDIKCTRCVHNCKLCVSFKINFQWHFLSLGVNKLKLSSRKSKINVMNPKLSVKFNLRIWFINMKSRCNRKTKFPLQQNCIYLIAMCSLMRDEKEENDCRDCTIPEASSLFFSQKQQSSPCTWFRCSLLREIFWEFFSLFHSFFLTKKNKRCDVH